MDRIVQPSPPSCQSCMLKPYLPMSLYLEGRALKEVTKVNEVIRVGP